jgi:aminoglycoside/choline kinase family phosphotransferase
VLGAQRNTKLLGIFRRLAHRDGKTAYLAHIPRIWRYLERDLRHPALADLAAWFDVHFPPAGRERSR